MRRKEILSLLFKCYQESSFRSTTSDKKRLPERWPLRESGGDAVQLRLFANGKGGSGPRKAAREGTPAPVFPKNMNHVKGDTI